MREKGRRRIYLLVVAMVAVLILTAIAFCTRKIQTEMKTQLQQNLEDVANQNVLALRNQIRSNELLLEGLVSELKLNKENMADQVMQYQSFVEAYGLKRLGFCMPDGMTSSTDGAVTDLSHREFFQRGMEGKRTITGVLIDAMSDEHGMVNVMSIPIQDESGEVLGVACLTYDSEAFNDTLQLTSFDEQGYSCVINEKGEIVVAMGNNELNLSDNLFTDILNSDSDNAEFVEELQGRIERKESTHGIVNLSEKDYLYGTPVELMGGDVTWYMLTIVPSSYFDDRFDAIQKYLFLMDFFVLLVIGLGILLFVLLSREQFRETRRLAYEDPLTGGANYARFCQVVDSFRDRHGYLVSMNIKNFSNIKIAAGRAAGDDMIREIWNILKDAIRDNEMIGRVREDHFALFITENNEEAFLNRMEDVSYKIHELARRIQVPGVYPHYGVYWLKESESVEDGFSKARIAENFVSSDHAKHYVFYSEIDHNEMYENEKLEERFEEAIANKEFEVWYQPKYSANGTDIVGSEALVRWRSTDGSMISPGRFIPLFEKNGMIAKLDEYMFRSVCSQQVEWQQQGFHIRPVSVNLSRASLYYSDIVERYENILKEYRLEAKYIQIEVTESAMEGKADILKVLGQFRHMGVHILMDDFGTGYSSLAILSMRCFDTLKLDKSLIDQIGEENGETLLYHVISMGQQLGLHITAEGVENTMQLKYLQKLNCDDIQGFLFARPMPASDYENLMCSFASNPT